jgi:hypothetical protein
LRLRSASMGSHRVPGILWHRRFVSPWGRTSRTECYWPVLRASFAEVGATQFRGSDVTSGRDSGFCITITHTSLVVQQFLAEKNIHVITQPPYSPDDFWLFPALKMGLKGTCFSTMEDIKSFLTMVGSIDQVCVCARDLLWRWLGKSCFMYYHYSVIR